ncbi:hypothetical protein KSP39_PZI005247 [Platanthera zijinensis]|uniref:CS domain-containing protein n=1 Tax=Platanthera zijinensis TaxID=2320716 RepID=A0AAP0BS12_9ASPA
MPLMMLLGAGRATVVGGSAGLSMVVVDKVAPGRRVSMQDGSKQEGSDSVVCWRNAGSTVGSVEAVGGVNGEKVETNFQETSVDVKFHDVQGKNYRIAIPKLNKEIVPAKSKLLVKATKIIITLVKASKGNWLDLHFKEDKPDHGLPMHDTGIILPGANRTPPSRSSLPPPPLASSVGVPHVSLDAPTVNRLHRFHHPLS